jgi:hypothetical protein
MKVEFLKHLESPLGKYLAGEIHELEHDAYTIENWIETGYCKAVEKVKSKLKKDEPAPVEVKQDETLTSPDK